MLNPEFLFCLNEGLDDSFLPTKAEPNATGWDVRAAADYVFRKPFDHHKIDLGFKTLIPEGYWLELRPRSSMHAKNNLNCLYGVIDQDYEDNVLFSAQWIPAMPYTALSSASFSLVTPLRINKGDRIGQLVPVKRLEMDVKRIDSDTFNQLSRKTRSGGFGSTGK
jgi:dUTPase